jgi:lambda family phage tail tape measure protein
MASQNIARLGIVLGLDSGELVTKITEAQQKFGQFKAQIKRDSEDAAKEIVRLEAATRNYGKTLTEVEKIEEQIRLGKYKHQPDLIVNNLLKQAAAYDKVAAAAKLAQEAQMGPKGGLTAQQSAALGYQTTDIVTSLAGGQNPLMVLLQQGGQLKDQFGGFKPMFAGIAEALTPVRLAVGGIAGVLGTLAYAFSQGAEESKKFQNAMVLTGQFAGMSQARVEGLAKTIREDYGISISQSREVMQQLVASGQFTYKSLQSVAEVIAKVASLSGESAADVADKLIPSFDGTAASAKRLNDQYHFLTIAQYKHIEALNIAGKSQEAAQYTADALNKQLKQQQEYLGYIERSWKAVKNAASDFWDWLKSIGREEDPLVAAIKNEAAMMETLTRQFGDNASKSPQYQKALENYKKFAAEMDAQEAARQKKADEQAKIDTGISNYAGAGGASKAADLVRQRAEILADIKYQEEAKGLTKVEQLTLQMNRDLLKAKAEQDKANINEKYAFAGDRAKLLEAQERQIRAKAQKDIEDLYHESRKVFEEKTRAEGDSISKEREKVELYRKNVFSSKEDLDIAESRLKTQQQLQELYDRENMKDTDRAKAADRIRALGDEREALIKQQETLKQLQEVNAAVYSSMTQTLQDFVRTGKLSFKDFASSIVNELINIQIRAMALRMTTGLGSLLGFGAAAASGGVDYSLTTGQSTGGLGLQMKAAGGPVAGNQPYIVGENGPELFVPPGSGTIVPNNMLGSMAQSGPTINYNGPYIANMSAIDTQSATQFLSKNKMAVWSANQSANRSIPASR